MSWQKAKILFSIFSEEKMRGWAIIAVVNGGPVGLGGFKGLEEIIIFGVIQEFLGGLNCGFFLYSVEIVEVEFLDFSNEIIGDISAGRIVYPHHRIKNNAL